MTVRKIEVERFSVTSSRPFAAVVAAIKASVGLQDMAEFERAIRGSGSFADLERKVHESLGKTGLMLFVELDPGAVLRKESGRETPKIVRLLIGNPLIMKEMAKHVPDAGSYAPITILVDERPEGVRLSYDRMTSLLAPYENAAALAVARELDSKVESLLIESAV
jgi:uncharacterized protein (DUF302 family)